MLALYVINIKPEHWEACRKGTIYGIEHGAHTPFDTQGRWKRGDVCLARVSHGGQSRYGVRAIWYLESEKRVSSKTKIPWKDFDCEWFVQLRPLVEFKSTFSEEFKTKHKHSEKVNMNASRLQPSVIRLTQSEADHYLRALLDEKKNELAIDASYMDTKVRVDSFLNRLAKPETLLVLEQHSPGLSEYDDQVGEQYHYPQLYFKRMAKGSRFIYCRPKKGEEGQKVAVYFGTGTVGGIRQDTTREGHRYCQIENYFEFPKEVEYVDKRGVYLETGTRKQPVMRMAVRQISADAYQRIIRQSDLENDQNLVDLLKASDDPAKVKQLNESYRFATPKMKQVLTMRIERDTAIGGRVKELNNHVCQVCGSLPFVQRTGRPYAEAHHLTPLHSREPGSLASQNVICVCANCHRKMHYGNVRITENTADQVVFEIDGKHVVTRRNRI